MKKIILSRYSLKNQFERTEFNPYTMKNNIKTSIRSYSIEMLAHPIAKIRERVALGKIFIELKGGLK